MSRILNVVITLIEQSLKYWTCTEIKILQYNNIYCLRLISFAVVEFNFNSLETFMAGCMVVTCCHTIAIVNHSRKAARKICNIQYVHNCDVFEDKCI